MNEKFKNIMDNKNIIFGDVAYDSNVLNTRDIKFGKIITPHNPRNSKKIDLIDIR
jgi:hypothetical protein